MSTKEITKIKPVYLQIIQTGKQKVKDCRSSKKPIIRLSISFLYTIKIACTTVRRTCVDANFRSILLMQLLNSKNVHQTTSFTCIDRYPDIFSACRDYFQDKQGLKILSYGCSTGEEVLTLRKYFPSAQITGAEINKRSLEICRKLPVDEKTSFIYSKPDEIQKHGPFDAIFCMAVLQRQPHHIIAKGIKNLRKIYPFEKFEQQVIRLDQLVNPQGLLIIHLTQYSLRDTAVALKYKALGNYTQDTRIAPIFDKNSKLVNTPAPLNTIFIKLHRKNLKPVTFQKI